MPVGAGAGAASGRAWGWEWRPMTTGKPWPMEPALEADLDGLHGEGVEDHLDARAHQGGVDLEGVAVQGDRGRLGHRARPRTTRTPRAARPGVGSAGGPPASNRSMGASPVSEWARR